MSARPGILITEKRKADGGVSPNQYVPWITAEIRCSWPPRASADEIKAAITAAYHRALVAVDLEREYGGMR